MLAYKLDLEFVYYCTPPNIANTLYLDVPMAAFHIYIVPILFSIGAPYVDI